MTALLIERYNGRMPTWLAPVQVAILPVSASRHGQDAGVFAKQLQAAGLRIKVRSEGTLGNRIREARNHRDCYIAVLGDAEIAAGTVNIVSSVDKGTLTIEDFVSRISAEIRNRSRMPEVLLEP